MATPEPTGTRRPRPLVSAAYQARATGRAAPGADPDRPTIPGARRPRPLVSAPYRQRLAAAQAALEREAQPPLAAPAPRRPVTLGLAGMVVPVSAALGTGLAVSRIVPPPSGAWPSLGWYLAVLGLSLGALIGVDRLFRRLLPTRSAPRLSKVLSWVAAGFASGLFAAVALPVVVGGRSFVVMSGSMEPAIHTGDVVVTFPIRPTKARVGDVVTFRDPADPERLITHRVRRVQPQGSTVIIETKGDANNTGERWHIPAKGSIGRVTHRVWRLGYVLHAAGSRHGRLLMVGGPALALCGMALVRIWRPRRPAVALPSTAGALAAPPAPPERHSWSIWDPFPV